jgi:DNA-binding beta-propeller fold protein YncE
MTRVLCALTACIAGALAGCFNPGLDGFACGPAGECPQGYECSADNLCVAPGTPVGDGGGNNLDRQAPLATIAFPLPVGMTEASTIAVRGRASDASDIRAIRVNGAAAVSNNGFLDWQADVPLVPGTNVLAVETEDVYGNLDASAASATILRTSRLLVNPSGMAVTPDGNTAVVFDQAGRALVSVDLATGERSVISDGGTGAGPALVDVDQLAVTPDGTAVLAVDVFEASVVTIDLATGDRRIVSGDLDGSGEPFDALAGPTLSPGGETAFVGDDVKNVLFAVDLATGARTVVSGTNAGGVTIGVGPAFDSITAVAFDAANTGVLVVDAGLQALIGVESGSGDRIVLSNANKGAGPALVQPVGVAASPDGSVAFVADVGLNALLVVDIDTGDRAVISGMGQGSGVEFSDIESLAIHPDFSRAFVTDGDSLVPIVVDFQNGARSLVDALDVGSGTTIEDPESVALDPIRDRLVVADDGLDGLLLIDLATGDRTLLADSAAVPLENPEVVAIHPDGLRAVVVDSTEDSCVTVDLATGNRTLVSSEARGTGPLLDAPEAMTLNAAGTVALVADLTPALVSVDMLTGERVLISDNDSATGIGFRDPTAMILDEARNRVVIADPGARGLVAVDLGTGVRTELGGGGPTLRFTEALALAGTPDRAVAYDSETRVYLLVDLVTGDRSMLATAELRANAPLGSPEAMTIDRERNVLLVADVAFSALIAIDLATGARLIVSR